MSPKRPSADYVFHARVRKDQFGPTFLHFVSPTPPNHSVFALPTVTREFGKASSVPVVKPEVDVEQALPALSQLRSALRPSASVVMPHTMISRTPTVQSYASPPGTSPAPSHEASIASSRARGITPHLSAKATSERGTTPSRARSATPHPALKATADAGLRASSVGRFKVSGGIPPSASRAPTPAPPIRPEDFYPPPDLPPPSGRITRSASAARASLSGIKAPSSSSDLSVTGVTLPEPGDPNDYVRFKKSCQLTDEEKQRSRKGKNAAPDQLFTAWFEKEGAHPLRHPPDLSEHAKIEYGDIFWYCSPYGVQMWLWTEGEDDGADVWRSVSLGAYRSVDGRYLGLNPSQRPSWMSNGWFAKKQKNTVRVFIFKC